MRVVKVDPEVYRKLYELRLPTERNHSQVIRRLLRSRQSASSQVESVRRLIGIDLDAV